MNEITVNTDIPEILKDYDLLAHKPCVNGIVLEGNKTTNDLFVIDSAAVQDSENLITSGAVYDSIINMQVQGHNHDSLYYTRAQTDGIVSGLETELSLKADISSLSAAAVSGDYNDLTNIPEPVSIPENVSAFTNDASYATKTYVDAMLGSSAENFENGLNEWGDAFDIRLAAKAESGHQHDNRYYLKSECDERLALKENALVFDTAPTGGSINSVTSGAVKAALDSQNAYLCARSAGYAGTENEFYSLLSSLDGVEAALEGLL